MEQLYPVCVCVCVFKGSQQVIICHSEFLLHLCLVYLGGGNVGGGLTQVGVSSEHHRKNPPSKLNRTDKRYLGNDQNVLLR